MRHFSERRFGIEKGLLSVVERWCNPTPSSTHERPLPVRRRKSDLHARVNRNLPLEFDDVRLTSYAGLELLERCAPVASISWCARRLPTCRAGATGGDGAGVRRRPAPAASGLRRRRPDLPAVRQRARRSSCLETVSYSSPNPYHGRTSARLGYRQRLAGSAALHPEQSHLMAPGVTGFAVPGAETPWHIP